MHGSKLKENVEEVMQSAIARTCHYFETEFGISVTKVDAAVDNRDSLTLLDMTAIIGMGGLVNLLIAFSFQDGLINALYQRMTRDMQVEPDEVEMYREAAAGEIVNTILGHCTIDLQKLDRRGISMTPPVILDRAKTIRRTKNSMFFSRGLNTTFGQMSINLVRPLELFDRNLDYKK
jgi:CheY-specific phosphatase CheX